MIEEQGISFRMDDLAKALTISKRTLYEQFRSKHEIVETILVHGAEDFYRQHENIVNNKSLTVEEVLNRYFKKDWDLLKHYLLHQQEQGTIARYVDVDIIIMMLQGAVRRIVFESSNHHEDIYKYMPKVISVILQGITNKGEMNEKTSV